jgi:sRNA-binding protein
MEPRNTVGEQAKEFRENAHELLEEARRQKAERKARKAKRKEGAKLLKEGIFGKKEKKNKDPKMEPELIINTGDTLADIKQADKKSSLFGLFSCCCAPKEEDDMVEERRRLLSNV